ncbi:MAG: FecR domain-containing protein [Hyphomicrobiales bacterium]|nr:FecR domain-containing protein [Hyphomicrobiales bacterium]MCP5371956.1 FecR domain-containing protein [Hyphomicrobiales bacterium]
MVVLRFNRAMRRSALALAGLIPAVQGALAAETIGVVATAENRITGTLDQRVRDLKVSQDIFRNEVIQTHDGASTQLLFLDETTLTLGPNSQVTLDEMVYDPQSGVGSVALSVVRGAAKFVTGVQDPKAYLIKTPTSNIGIRGSGIGIFVGATQTLIVLLEGLAIVNNLLGVTQILDQVGTYTIVGGQNTPPSTPAPAPPSLLGRFGGALGAGPLLLPTGVEQPPLQNLPVDVQELISNATSAGLPQTISGS